jgi:hypothetical protein
MNRSTWAALLSATVLGCTGTDEETDSGQEEISTVDPLVRDLVRVHQEVFGRLVLFTISEDDCEYSVPDTYGPEEFVLDAENWPYPEIEGTLSLSVEMAPVDGNDLWTMLPSYEAVAAGVGLSEGERPVLEGSGTWTVQVPGRDHTLDLQLSVDGAEATTVDLRFGISDYISGGYIFGVTGSIGGEGVDTTVEADNPCPGDSR